MEEVKETDTTQETTTTESGFDLWLFLKCLVKTTVGLIITWFVWSSILVPLWAACGPDIKRAVIIILILIGTCAGYKAEKNGEE